MSILQTWFHSSDFLPLKQRQVPHSGRLKPHPAGAPAFAISTPTRSQQHPPADAPRSFTARGNALASRVNTDCQPWVIETKLHFRE
ncbi:hypothetical protein MATL_G00115040 [Megalops atlanticus]|uniref:Uncharacterized protein n=1 Tax=Megalops atlanticus TaxID=7932 RepID=A0A9D3T7S7_MEGAT|nr:hypothetical protein MATL_G00115040 [Megalops atlanticus]